jgi:hypothetical protein
MATHLHTVLRLIIRASTNSTLPSLGVLGVVLSNKLSTGITWYRNFVKRPARRETELLS